MASVEAFFQLVAQASSSSDGKKQMAAAVLQDRDLIHARGPFGGVEQTTPLHIAATGGDVDVLEQLIWFGHPWNALDSEQRSAGEIALLHHHQPFYQRLREEGIRLELILRHMQDSDTESEEEVLLTDQSVQEEEEKPYLAQQVEYSADGFRLLDSEQNGVMMSWEEPIMQRSAQLLSPKGGRRILNVGFGMGIIDGMIQAMGPPAEHHIIEAHPGVLAKMKAEGWFDKQGVVVHQGTWQTVMPRLIEEGIQLDGIYWDTFGEDYDTGLLRFFQQVPACLAPNGGVFSFFNGLGGTNPFFHDVYCEIAKMDLAELGLCCTYENMPVASDASGEGGWQGIKRRYFSLETYHLPIIRFDDSLLAA